MGTVKQSLSSVLTVSATLLLLLGLWQLTGMLLDLPRWLIPLPSAIAESLWDNFSILLPHIEQTLIEVASGMLLAIILAVCVAAVLDYSPVLQRIIYPLLILSQTIPIIALAPLLVIWFGFGLLPKVIVVTLFCFFPIAINTADGFSATTQEMMNLFRSMNASRYQIWSKLRLPAALPYFFSGLKVAATYSVIAAIIGEWVGAERGLGMYLLRSAASFQTVQVFAVITIISLLSILVFAFVLILERFIIPWKFVDKPTDNHKTEHQNT